MVHGSETDPEVRLVELYARRTALDQEIPELSGRHPFESRARKLASTWSGAKGELLDEVVGSREAITDTDQGRSFQAFYDLLLSSARQEELASLLDRVHALDVIPDPDLRMRHVHHAWLDAGERTQETVRRLSEQLRRFLDDQVWFENRRVIDILREIESTALRLRDRGEIPLTMEIDETAPSTVLPMERPLYTAVERVPISSAAVEAGQDDYGVDGLFDQVHVDPERLAANVRTALRRSSQIGLIELLRRHPLDQGLAELVVYLSLTDDGFQIVLDEGTRERIGWRDEDGTECRATLPKVIFARSSSAWALPDHGEPGQ